MTNPFKIDRIADVTMSPKTLSAFNAQFSIEDCEEIKNRPVRTFSARFIRAGLVGYKEMGDITLIEPKVLDRMVYSLVNRAVIKKPHDLDITSDNIMKKAKGRVIEVWKEEGSDSYWCKIEIWDKELLRAIDEDGYGYVSCAYFITENGGSGRFDGIDYTTHVLDGFFHHIDITDSPRYNHTDLFRLNEQGKSLILIRDSGIVKLNEIKESNKGEKEMLGFKKTSVEFDETVLYRTNDFGELNVKQLIEKLDTVSSRCNDLEAENNKLKQSEADRVAAEEAAKEEQAKAEADEKSHEPSTEVKEAAAKADEAAATSETIKEATPRENDDAKQNVAEVAIK